MKTYFYTAVSIAAIIGLSLPAIADEVRSAIAIASQYDNVCGSKAGKLPEDVSMNIYLEYTKKYGTERRFAEDAELQAEAKRAYLGLIGLNAIGCKEVKDGLIYTYR